MVYCLVGAVLCFLFVGFSLFKVASDADDAMERRRKNDKDRMDSDDAD